MSALLLTLKGLDPAPWERRFRTLAPQRDIRVWPDRVGDPAGVRYVCAWNPPHGLMAGFPNLAAMFSLGAGVDHLTGDPRLPDVPLVRVVDPDLTMRMTEYIVLHVLACHRRAPLYAAQQARRLWHDLEDQPAAREVTVGLMGIGVLGGDAAQVLKRIGFDVAGWSRGPKSLPHIASYHGAGQLDAFLNRTEILVCVLPHTPETRGILNLALLRKLKRDGALRGASLINAGRGMLQIDDDILAALKEGSLAHAVLDVFPTEPLAADSPFWTHPKVTITPHNAATVAPAALAASVLDQIAHFEAGQPLENLVDRRAGY